MTVYQPFEGDTEAEFNAHHIDKKDFLLCHNCGWNAYHQRCTSYRSTLKVTTNASRGIWFVGNNYVLKERKITEHGRRCYLGPEVPITKFLAENSTIPVAKYVHFWNDSISYFFFMEKVPGQTLESAWRTLTPEQEKVIAKEVVEYLIQLRKFTSEKIEAPDGSSIRDTTLGTHKRIDFVTDDVEEWWARVKPHLQNKWDGKKSSGQWKKSLKSRYPVKGPYVLTHGDLNATNIFVKDGHVTGIIDWEHGGYLPEWWEHVKLRIIELGDWHYVLEMEMSKQFGTFKTEKNFYREFDTGFDDQRGDDRVNEGMFFDPNFYSRCPNYARYMEEDDLGFDLFKFHRDIRREEQAEENAAFAAFKALSLKEREDLVGKNNA
ncbi:00058b72-4108-4d8b-bcdc-112d9837ac49 [Sclerotinia trifoliorum]|uniref:00058b72-4108-4d8b-bcdc-112d9837ac49 n=1 Tax=Sclerotinia trifoliorum TaxID=28548 RepID=A0A8H2VNZ4_9HELO|nr:00058b72-4108-4d8b-bcdc-112d9837ac49 [Sclerotinia trifoliorum]